MFPDISLAVRPIKLLRNGIEIVRFPIFFSNRKQNGGQNKVNLASLVKVIEKLASALGINMYDKQDDSEGNDSDSDCDEFDFAYD